MGALMDTLLSSAQVEDVSIIIECLLASIAA